jgi:hypothetical protein
MAGDWASMKRNPGDIQVLQGVELIAAFCLAVSFHDHCSTGKYKRGKAFVSFVCLCLIPFPVPVYSGEDDRFSAVGAKYL